MFKKKSEVNQNGDKYIYVNPSADNDRTIREINIWASKGYRLVASSAGMLIMEKDEIR